MTEWWTYRLSDFLLFSPRTYWRMFELHNEALWPLPLLTLAIGVAAAALAALRPRHHGLLLAILLAILWAFVGWSFLWQRYATINWAAAYAAPLFPLEALLLIVAGAIGRLSFDQHGARRLAGFALIIFALAGYPALAPLSGRPWVAAEIFGIAPGPTVIGTMGLLLLARGRLAFTLLPIPLLWCLADTATLLAMQAGQAWVPVAAGLLAAATGSERRAA